MDIRPLTFLDQAALDRAVVDVSITNPGWTFVFDYTIGDDYTALLKILDDNYLGRHLRTGKVPSSYLVAVIDGEIVGRVSIRHKLNEDLKIDGGHIGYCVRKSWRGQGIAKEMLRWSLRYTKDRELGLNEVMLTCDDDNIASYKVIEACGGHLQEYYELNGVRKRRYTIAL